MEYLFQLEENRTAQDVTLIKKEISIDGIVSSILGPFANNKQLYNLAIMASTAEAMVTPLFLLKLHFDRVRPSFYDDRLQPSIELPPHPAYPSGHATQATTVALILGCVDPDNRDFYLSNRVGWNRELAGVHYPSDTVAGERLAHHIIQDVATQLGIENATSCSGAI